MTISLPPTMAEEFEGPRKAENHTQTSNGNLEAQVAYRSEFSHIPSLERLSFGGTAASL